VNPTRREFMRGAAAGTLGVGAALFIQLPADAQASAEAQLVDAHGLPPSGRQQVQRCAKCGRGLGGAVFDELDNPTAAAVVCANCFKAMRTELRQANTRFDRNIEAVELQDDEIDGLRNELSDLERAHTRLRKQLGNLEWPMRDIEDLARRSDNPALARQVERTRELVDALVRASVP
jgi:hypothetical protein